MPVCPASGKANLTGKQWTFFASSGGGASGGAMAFCLCRPGSNPGTEMAFLVQNCCSSILTGFLKERVIERCILLHLFNFLSSFTIANCTLSMNKEKGKINPK